MKSAIRTLFLQTVAYYAVIIFVPNKISFVVVTVGYFFVLWRFTKDFQLSLAAVYLALSPFVIGKTFEIELISARELAIPWRPFGISADVLVTFQDASVAVMAVYVGMIAWNRKLRYARNSLLEFLLFLYPAGTIIATYMGSVRPEVSFLHAPFTLKPIIVFYFFASTRNFSIRRVLGIFAAGLCLEAFVVAMQILKGGSLGLLIEPIYNYVIVDASLDAAGLIRYSGTYMHANALANGLLIPLFALLPYVVRYFGRYGNVFRICFLFGFGAFVATMSRSAWGSMVVGIGLFVYLAFSFWGYRFQMMHSFSAVGRWFIGISAAACMFIVLPRIVSTAYTNSTYGSVETRVLLLREYSELMKAYPLFGVGLEMDVYTGYVRSLVRENPNKNSLTGSVLQYFPEPAHNGIIRLAVQSGVGVLTVYLCLFCMFVYAGFRNLAGSQSAHRRLISLSLVCMVIATFVNSMMQPILPDLPMLIAIMSAYGKASYEIS